LVNIQLYQQNISLPEQNNSHLVLKYVGTMVTHPATVCSLISTVGLSSWKFQHFSTAAHTLRFSLVTLQKKHTNLAS